MTFQYLWLKILELLDKDDHPMNPPDLHAKLRSRGFSIDKKELADSLARMRDHDLVEMLVFAGSETATAESVRITSLGKRRIRNIVRF